MNNIIISELSKSFDGKKVIDNFSAELRRGEITALMAPSGGGKTTLLRILMGLERADSGAIAGMEGLRISAVFQEDRLCPRLDPVANIRLVNPKNSPSAVTSALNSVGLSDCVNQPAEELSGGMKRRVAILRALMAEYELLLLDEPFRGLDEETKKKVMADTLSRCKGRTVLLVTHDETELEAMKIEKCLSF